MSGPVTSVASVDVQIFLKDPVFLYSAYLCGRILFVLTTFIETPYFSNSPFLLLCNIIIIIIIIINSKKTVIKHAICECVSVCKLDIVLSETRYLLSVVASSACWVTHAAHFCF